MVRARVLARPPVGGRVGEMADRAAACPSSADQTVVNRNPARCPAEVVKAVGRLAGDRGETLSNPEDSLALADIPSRIRAKCIPARSGKPGWLVRQTAGAGMR